MEEASSHTNPLANRFDLKGSTTLALNEAIKHLTNNTDSPVSFGLGTKIIVMTNFATIYSSNVRMSGHADDSDVEDGDVSAKYVLRTTFRSVIKARNEMADEFQRDSEPDFLRLINESAALTLEDVTLVPFANPSQRITMPSLMLFADQIVGLSVGELR